MIAAQAGTARSRADHQRRAAGRSDRRAESRRPRPHHRQPRHAAPRSLHGADALRSARRASTRASPRPLACSAALKIDTVVIRGVNDDELVDLIEYGRSVNGEVRFIEYMDVGGATRWSPDARRVARRRCWRRSTQHYGAIAPVVEPGSSAPADRYRAARRHRRSASSRRRPSRSARTCDRSRLTADGMWYLCLYATRGIDLRAPLRAGRRADELQALIAGGWQRARRPRRRRSPGARRSARVRAGAGSAEARIRTSRCTRAAASRLGGCCLRRTRSNAPVEQQQRHRLQQTLHAARLVEERFVFPQRHLLLEQPVAEAGQIQHLQPGVRSTRDAAPARRRSSAASSRR